MTPNSFIKNGNKRKCWNQPLSIVYSVASNRILILKIRTFIQVHCDKWKESRIFTRANKKSRNKSKYYKIVDFYPIKDYSAMQLWHMYKSFRPAHSSCNQSLYSMHCGHFLLNLHALYDFGQRGSNTSYLFLHYIRPCCSSSVYAFYRNLFLSILRFVHFSLLRKVKICIPIYRKIKIIEISLFFFAETASAWLLVMSHSIDPG